VLVIVFGFVVYKTLGMPNFDEKLLALMGLSSGTYLGSSSRVQVTPRPFRDPCARERAGPPTRPARAPR